METLCPFSTKYFSRYVFPNMALCAIIKTWTCNIHTVLLSNPQSWLSKFIKFSVHFFFPRPGCSPPSCVDLAVFLCALLWSGIALCLSVCSLTLTFLGEYRPWFCASSLSIWIWLMLFMIRFKFLYIISLLRENGSWFPHAKLRNIDYPITPTKTSDGSF